MNYHILCCGIILKILNINKRVNWDASRNFAIGGTLLLYTIQPILNTFLKNTKLNKKIIISLCIGIPMFIDIIYHVIFKQLLVVFLFYN